MCAGGGDPPEAVCVWSRRPGPELHQRAHREVLPLSQVGGAAGLRLHLPGVQLLSLSRVLSLPVFQVHEPLCMYLSDGSLSYINQMLIPFIRLGTFFF